MGCLCSKNEAHTVKHRDNPGTTRDVSSFSAATGSRSAEEPRCYVALWDYKKASNAELSFHKGDMFVEVTEECDAGPEWIFVTQEKMRKSKRGEKKEGSKGTGYIPRNFVAIRDSLEAESYYFGEIARDEAAALLHGKPTGTFLLRSRAGEFLPHYALTVSCDGKIKHLKIHCNQNPQSPKFNLAGRSSSDVRRLLSHFLQAKSRAIGCKLITSPPRPVPNRPVISADIEKHWQEIPRSQIHIECQVGKGFYGVVHRGVWEPQPGTKLQVAVKELKAGVIEGRVNFLAEAVAMKNLSHPRLVKLLGVVSTDEPFYIITEFMKGGALRTYLWRRARDSSPLQESQLVNIACQVAEGMRYLEEKNVVHRDLAARNVLIQEVASGEAQNPQHFDVKIADFGLARMIKTGNTMKERRALNLPTKWMAPEALTEAKFSTASDVWSFGILLYEIFTHGKEPYDGMSTHETRKFVIDDKKTLQRTNNMPEGIYNLLVNCCEYSPASRPLFQHIHCYLQSFYEAGAYYRYFYEKKV